MNALAPQVLPRPGSREEARGRYGVLTVIVAALLLRMWRLGAQSLWTDEGSTWTAATAPFFRLFELCATKDASPPLFYLLTAIAMKFGDSEIHLRLVSVFASVGLVWATYRLTRLVADRQVATLAAALTALSPYQLMFAQEARTYALVAFWMTLALYLFARAVLFDQPRAWLPYILVSALALWTQNIALLGIGVQAVFVIFSRTARRQLLPWVVAQVATIVLYLPWLFVSIAQAGRLSSSHWYLGVPVEHSVIQVLRAVFLAPLPLVTAPPGSPLPGLGRWVPPSIAYVLLIAAPLVPLALALRGLHRSTPEARFRRLCFAAFLLPIVAVLAVSFYFPLWLPRYFVFTTPMLAVLLALGVSALRPRALSLAWAMLLFLVAGYADFRYFTDFTKERWREVAHSIAERARPGRTAVLVTFDADPYRFYNQRLQSPLALFEVSHPEVPFASGYTQRHLAEIEHRLRDDTTGFDEVWVVVRSPNSMARLEAAKLSQRVAGEGRALIERERWEAMQGPLRVSHYRRIGTGGDAASASIPAPASVK